MKAKTEQEKYYSELNLKKARRKKFWCNARTIVFNCSKEFIIYISCIAGFVLMFLSIAGGFKSFFSKDDEKINALKDRINNMESAVEHIESSRTIRIPIYTYYYESNMFQINTNFLYDNLHY